MKSKLLLSICLFFLATHFSLFTKAQAVNKGDSLALVDLYNNCDGTNWRYHGNWLTPAPVAYWEGVEVTNGRVTYINLIKNRMNGVLPASLGNLSALIYLELSYNQLHGSLPASIGNLVSLQNLYLKANDFTGNLPSSLGNMVNLLEIELHYNDLSGGLPASFGNLTNLQSVYLQHNNLTDSLPSSIGNLKRLRTLFLYDNHLSGKLPASLGDMSALQYADLHNNNFSGDIPSSLGSLSNLNVLYLNGNKLSGSIPASFQNLYYLENLNLSKNKLTGIIPASLASNVHLNGLVLDSNALSGELPAALFTLKYLDYISVSHNKLTESSNIPASLVNKKNYRIYIDNNRYTFNGIEALAGNKKNEIRYTPQASLQLHQQPGSLSVSAGGTLGNNTYYWFKVGRKDSVVITVDSSFEPLQNGLYYAKISNRIATQLVLYTDTINFVMSDPVVKTIAAAHIYPNPVYDELNIVGLDAKQHAVISITDANGAVRMNVMSKQQTSVRCNVNHLQVGAYSLTIVYIDGSTQTFHFIKQ